MKYKKPSKLSIPAILILFLALWIFKGNSGIIDNELIWEEGNLLVHFIDVGQGDCELVELPEGEIMLIDAGDNGYEDIVTGYLDDLGIERIDYLIATHPHADHIGGMEEVIKRYDIGEIYMPKAASESRTFEKMLDAIEEKGLLVHTAEAGKAIFSGKDLKADILSPKKGELYEDTNNNSVVLRLVYGKKSFLFTGDIESEAERDIIFSGIDISSEVLKVAHHGSSTSSIYEFIEAVNPSYAVISCGEDNEYGHPHRETLYTFQNIGSKILRTDELGTVKIMTDGKNLEVENKKEYEIN